MMNRKLTALATAMALFLALGVLTACAKGEEATPIPSAVPTPPTATVPAAIDVGTLEVRVTDAPDPEVTSVLVTVADVEVHRAAPGEWRTVVEGPATFDLIALAGVEAVLGSEPLEAGRYTQVRLKVSSVEVVRSGETTEAEVPSGELKLVGTFVLEPGETTIITLDFEVEDSLVQRGPKSMLFKPVVKLLGGESGEPGKPTVPLTGAPATPVPTATSEKPGETKPPDTGAPAAEEVICITTLMAPLPIEFEFAKDRIPTGFDGANTASCTFPEPIEKITVILTGEGGLRHTEVFTLEEPTAAVQFPLPETALGVSTLEMIPPGEYEREMVAEAADGETYDIAADQGALKSVTVLPPGGGTPATEEVVCRMTRAAPLPITFEFGKDRIPTGFDGINKAGCTFPELIEKVTVVLSGSEGGPQHFETFSLPEPTLEVDFPLDDDVLSFGTLEMLPPGEYERVMQAVAADGDVYDLTVGHGALGAVTVVATGAP